MVEMVHRSKGNRLREGVDKVWKVKLVAWEDALLHWANPCVSKQEYKINLVLTK